MIKHMFIVSIHPNHNNRFIILSLWTPSSIYPSDIFLFLRIPEVCFSKSMEEEESGVLMPTYSVSLKVNVRFLGAHRVIGASGEFS